MKLTDPWQLTVLKAQLPQRINDHVEMDSSKLGTHQDVRNEVMQFAMHMRLQQNVQGTKDHNNIDTAHVTGQEDWGWTTAASPATTAGPATIHQNPWASTWWWPEAEATVQEVREVGALGQGT